MSKIALAVRHIHFEDLGTFEGALEKQAMRHAIAIHASMI